MWHILIIWIVYLGIGIDGTESYTENSRLKGSICLFKRQGKVQALEDDIAGMYLIYCLLL